MFENPRRGRQARNFTTNVPKILDLKSSSEQIFSENCRWVPLRTDMSVRKSCLLTVQDCGERLHQIGWVPQVFSCVRLYALASGRSLYYTIVNKISVNFQGSEVDRHVGKIHWPGV